MMVRRTDWLPSARPGADCHRRRPLPTALLLAALALIAAGCEIPQIEAAREPEAGPDQTPGSQPENEPESEPAGPPPQEEPPGPPPQEQLPDLAIAAVSAGEDDGTLSFAVSLSSASGEPVSVAYGTDDGTATAGVDYQPARGRLTFAAAAATAQMIKVMVIDDDVAEPAETFTVRLSDPQGATLRVAAATGTIIDDEQRALLVEPRELNVPEGGTGSYRVKLGSRPTGPVTARVPEPADLSVDPNELQFTPADWSIAQQVQVTAAPDQDSEADPPVELVHEASGGGYEGTTASVRVTVVEADAATLAVAGGRTPEGAGPMGFSVTLSASVSQQVAVDYATGAPGDTATAGVDYVAKRGTLRFPAGSDAPQAVEVTLRDDALDEPDERITLTLRNASNATLAGGGDTATAFGTIEDDDDSPVVGIADDSVTEGAAAGELRFAVLLDQPSGRTVTVGYGTADVTATAGRDYTRAGGTLTFDPGTVSRTVAVPITDDTLPEPDEELTVTLSASVNATIDAAARTATGTILDDDEPPALAIAAARAREGEGPLRFSVTLQPVSGHTVTVSYATADATATAGADYTAASGVLTLDPGVATRTIAVPIADDALDEPDEETLTVTLGGAHGARVETATAAGTISDDDDPPELSIDDSSAAESAGTMHFTVKLHPASGNRVTVHYETEDGTAVDFLDPDYTKTAGTLTFRHGEVLEQTISVPILQDDVDEGDQETFTMTLLDPVNATLGDASAIGTITDDDEAPADDHGNTRATATSITQGSPISGRLETATDVDFFKVNVTSDSSLRAATDAGTVGDPGYPRGTVVRIESSDYTSTNNDAYDEAIVDLGLAASAEVYVRVSGSLATRYDVAVWLLEPNESDTSFDIELRYVGTEPTAAQKSTIRAAADVWERVITGDLSRRVIIDSTWECEDDDPSAFGDHVDDLRIDIRLERMDGVGGGVAAAGPCYLRSSGMPFIGDVTFDTSDLERLGTVGLRRVAVHEMAHVLGFGTSFHWIVLLRNRATGYVPGPGEPALPDTHLVSSPAVSAFNEVGGASYTGAKVPVENDTEKYGSGGLDKHWREAVFASELMTPTISTSSGTSQPISKVTIAVLAHLGYSVDYGEADSYTLPSGSQSQLKAARTAQDEIHVGDDIRSGPVVVAEPPDQHVPVITP